MKFEAELVNLSGENKENEKKRHSTSSVIKRDKATEIMAYLKDEIEKPDASKKYSYKTVNKFNIVIIDGKEVLFRTATPSNKNNKKKVDLNPENLPVAIYEDYFEILWNVHSIQKSHAGQNRTIDHVNNRFHNLPAKYVVAFIQLCPICNLKKKQQTQARLNPIRSDKLLDRLQIDLIDMRHNPSYFDDRRHLDKNLSKKDKEAKKNIIE